MKYLQRISDFIFNIEKVIIILLMITMLCSITAGVIWRYFFNSPLSWSEELAIFTLVWITFIGGSMGVKTSQAASFELIFEKLTVSAQRLVLIIGYGIVTAFCLFTGYLAYNWITNSSVSMQIAPSLGISMFLPYLGIPMGIFFMAIHSFNHLVQSFRYNFIKDGE